MRLPDDIAKGPMARLLSCPHCHAEFGFEDWAKAASCPTCGQRVIFFEANGRATSQSAAPAPAETALSPVPRSPAGSGAWDPLPDTAPALNAVAADRPAPSAGDANGATDSSVANGTGDSSAANGAGEDGKQGARRGGWTWSGPEGGPAAADDGTPSSAAFPPPTDAAPLTVAQVPLPV